MGLSILNLTKENASRKEKRVGIVEPEDKKYILELLNTATIENEKENAHKIALFAQSYNYECAAIEYTKCSFFNELELALLRVGIKPYYKKIIAGQIYLIESITTNVF